MWAVSVDEKQTFVPNFLNSLNNELSLVTRSLRLPYKQGSLAAWMWETLPLESSLLAASGRLRQYDLLSETGDVWRPDVAIGLERPAPLFTNLSRFCATMDL